MSLSEDDRQAFEAAQSRLRAILPEDYRETYETIQPVSMGSAGLKFGADGQVAWGEMWQSFCDLAMAGGPPHKGALLEPGSAAEIVAAPARYDDVVEEITRGIVLVTDLHATRSPIDGWVRVHCLSDAMAGWLQRAIVMENVAARRHGLRLDLPAGPHFRVEKEIKNVITVAAKTCHYWMGHIPRPQRIAIADLLVEMAQTSALIEPADERDDTSLVDHATARLAETIEAATGLRQSPRRAAGWLGLECAGVADAVWLMRALVTTNLLTRREETTLFVPVNPTTDRRGEIVAAAVGLMHALAAARVAPQQS